MTEPRVLQLLGREDCGLCEEFEQALREHPAFVSFELRRADVDEHPEWLRRYGLRVPVLLDTWNEVVCEGRFDAKAFEAWCRDLTRSAVR